MAGECPASSPSGPCQKPVLPLGQPAKQECPAGTLPAWGALKAGLRILEC